MAWSCALSRSAAAEVEYARRLHAASQRLADNQQCIEIYDYRGKAFLNAYVEGRKLKTLGRRPLPEPIDCAYPAPDCRCADCESALRTFLPHPIKDGFTHLGTSLVHKHLIEVAARSGRIEARVTKAGRQTRLGITKVVCLRREALTRATDFVRCQPFTYAEKLSLYEKRIQGIVQDREHIQRIGTPQTIFDWLGQNRRLFKVIMGYAPPREWSPLRTEQASESRIVIDLSEDAVAEQDSPPEMAFSSSSFAAASSSPAREASSMTLPQPQESQKRSHSEMEGEATDLELAVSKQRLC